MEEDLCSPVIIGRELLLNMANRYHQFTGRYVQSWKKRMYLFATRQHRLHRPAERSRHRRVNFAIILKSKRNGSAQEQALDVQDWRPS